MLDLRVGRSRVRRDEHGLLDGDRALSAAFVERHPGGDRERPRAEMLGVAKLLVRAKRAEERLLERVFRGLPPEQPHEVAVDLLPVRVVETLERWCAGHRVHHRL